MDENTDCWKERQGKKYCNSSSLLLSSIPLAKEYKPEGMGASIHSLCMLASWGTKQDGLQKGIWWGKWRFWHSTEIRALVSRDTKTRIPGNTYLMIRYQNMTQS